MAPPPLACTVRGCHAALTRSDRWWRCPHAHTFDVARAGYVNLLQPQDRRSPGAGDPPEAVAARARLRAAGVGRPIDDFLVETAVAALRGDAPVVVELGAGSGDTLAAIARRRAIAGVGIDLSPAAIQQAARRHPTITWVVANADRRLPILDAAADLVLSQHGRRHPVEVARILAAGGCLLVTVPAADDLIELRAAVQGEAVTRQRLDAVIAEHGEGFTVVDRGVVRHRARLDRDGIRDALCGTYRAGRTRVEARMASVGPMEVTFASAWCTLRRR